MAQSSESVEILRRDARGGVHTPKKKRDEILDEFERSGVSGAVFARFAGVKYQTFWQWWDKRRKGAESVASKTEKRELAVGGEFGPKPFYEAVVEGALGEGCGNATESFGLWIDLPGGSRMQVDSRAQLVLAAELVRLIATGGERRC